MYDTSRQLTLEISRLISTNTKNHIKETTFLFQRLSRALHRGNAVSVENTIFTQFESPNFI